MDVCMVNWFGAELQQKTPLHKYGTNHFSYYIMSLFFKVLGLNTLLINLHHATHMKFERLLSLNNETLT